MTERALHLALDRFAAVDGRRQVADLHAKHYPDKIPITTIALAAECFRVAVMRGMQDCRIAADHEALFVALLEIWQTAAAVELKRLARERGAPAS